MSVFRGYHGALASARNSGQLVKKAGAMTIKLGWPMAMLAILTFSFGQSAATAGQLTPQGAADMVTPTAAMAGDPPCGQAATSSKPTFFTDEVGQPPVAAPDSTNHYTLTAHLGSHSFHSGWPAVPTLGYSTANQKMDYLGPTIVTKEGTPINVKIVNALPAAGTTIFPQFGYPNYSNGVILGPPGMNVGQFQGSGPRSCGRTWLMGPRVTMIRARAAPAEWNPYARLMIRRTRLFSPSCLALLILSRTAASIPARRLRMVAARVTNGLRPLRWALEQNRSSRKATSVSSRSGSNTARSASLSPYARHSSPPLRLSLRRVSACWSVRSPGFFSSAQRAPLNRRAASLSGSWRSSCQTARRTFSRAAVASATA